MTCMLATLFSSDSSCCVFSFETDKLFVLLRCYSRLLNYKDNWHLNLKLRAPTSSCQCQLQRFVSTAQPIREDSVKFINQSKMHHRSFYNFRSPFPGQIRRDISQTTGLTQHVIILSDFSSRVASCELFVAMYKYATRVI